MARRASGHPGAPSAALAPAAAWLGVSTAAVAIDAVARGGVSIPHIVYLVCAAAPILIERLGGSASSSGAISITTAIAWLLGAATVLVTSGHGGGLLISWLALPVAAAVARGASRRQTLEATALTAVAAAALIAARLIPVDGPGWGYGALPIASALGVAVYAAFAAGRVASACRRYVARAGIETRRAALVLAASPDVFLTIDHRNRICAAVGGGEGKLADDAQIFLGGEVTGLFATSEARRFGQALDRVRRIGEPERLVLAGEEGLIEARIIRTDAREVVLVLRAASAEIEALPAAERERDAAEAASRARSRFFASMSHELRTPLNAVLGFSEVMRLKMFGPMPAKYAEYADDIHNSAKHLLDLVGDLLDVSKIEAGRYELEVSRFDAREALHAAARMTRPAADAGKIVFAIDAGDDPIEVEADLRALKQMLLNLTSNAIKFTAAGGSVRVSARSEASALVVEVADTGPGLTPEEISRIARPFEQTREGRRHPSRSSGLGLALVRSLCELHGGVLEIESEPGRGSTFRLRLPVLASDDHPGEGLDARGRLQRIRDAGFGGASGER